MLHCVIIITETWLNQSVLDAAIDLALEKLHGNIDKQLMVHPDSIITVAGDFKMLNSSCHDFTKVWITPQEKTTS